MTDADDFNAGYAADAAYLRDLEAMEAGTDCIGSVGWAAPVEEAHDAVLASIVAQWNCMRGHANGVEFTATGHDCVSSDEPPWHWFDHPEMQERIARAEADIREGRTTTTAAHKYLRLLRYRIHPNRHTSRYLAKGGVRK